MHTGCNSLTYSIPRGYQYPQNTSAANLLCASSLLLACPAVNQNLEQADKQWTRHPVNKEVSNTKRNFNFLKFPPLINATGIERWYFTRLHGQIWFSFIDSNQNVESLSFKNLRVYYFNYGARLWQSLGFNFCQILTPFGPKASEHEMFVQMASRPMSLRFQLQFENSSVLTPAPGLSRVDPRVNPRVRDPKLSRVWDPKLLGCQELEIPSSQELEISSSQALEIPSSQELEIPSSPELEITRSPELEIPSSPELGISSAWKLGIPSSQELEIPSTQERNLRAAGYMCAYVHAYTHICTYIHTYTHRHIYTHIHTYTRICTHMHTYTHIGH